MSTTRLVIIVTLGATIATPALADVCDEATAIQRSLAHLRRLSLDLRGRVPTVEEQSSVVTNGAIDPNIVDAMLSSEDFVTQIRRHHRDLLWTNVDDLRIALVSYVLAPPEGRRTAPAYFLTANNRQAQYRGGPAVCLDEPARFDPSTGEILTTPSEDDPRIRREGWVEVEPYWAPETTVRVCAFDAQTAETVTDDRGNSIDCRRQPQSSGCGCGPNLRWCQSPLDGTTRAITNAMSEQLLRFMDDIVRERRPYSEVILGKDFEINGPLAFWLEHQSQTGGSTLVAGPSQDHTIPERSFDDAAWEQVTRGDRHAGVLSMPGYLLKFPSNRGRANRFYEAFLCQHFESNESLPPATDACHAEPDLTKRCGCKGCHVAVEPAAAHWGRWAEAGLLALEAPAFPTFDAACAAPNAGRRDPRCRLFYFTDADVTDPAVEDEYVGMLRSYVFADETRRANIEEGPESIARSAVESGAFASCVTKKLWSRLITSEPDAQVVAALADEFSRDDDLVTLVRKIVERPEYIEAGLYEGVER